MNDVIGVSDTVSAPISVLLYHQPVMLNQLPTELRLKTLSYLGIRDLRNVQLISRSWRYLFVANEPTIYRYAAHLHALTPGPDISLDEAKDVSPPCSMHGVNSWKCLSK